MLADRGMTGGGITVQRDVKIAEKLSAQDIAYVAFDGEHACGYICRKTTVSAYMSMTCLKNSSRDSGAALMDQVRRDFPANRICHERRRSIL